MWWVYKRLFLTKLHFNRMGDFVAMSVLSIVSRESYIDHQLLVVMFDGLTVHWFGLSR